jgi:hypothetical protein
VNPQVERERNLIGCKRVPRLPSLYAERGKSKIMPERGAQEENDVGSTGLSLLREFMDQAPRTNCSALPRHPWDLCPFLPSLPCWTTLIESPLFFQARASSSSFLLLKPTTINSLIICFTSFFIYDTLIPGRIHRYRQDDSTYSGRRGFQEAHLSSPHPKLYGVSCTNSNCRPKQAIL